jgi:hypothetical protein
MGWIAVKHGKILVFVHFIATGDEAEKRQARKKIFFHCIKQG